MSNTSSNPSASMMIDRAAAPTLFGHPASLFTLFFAEMWERFSFYGMKAVLFYYMTKGFLGYNDNRAYGVQGAYTSLVYMTPFFGGMLADRLLGQRRAVIIGGVLMALGQLLLGVQHNIAFYLGLSLLVCGNGFFKPNISTIVGSLYSKDSPKKDAGFTIFYMGINLGAALAPIICAYVGEVYGWHRGFGLAAAGMLVGIAVFAAPTRLTQFLILVGAVGTAVAMPCLQYDNTLQLLARLFLAVALTSAGVIAVVALSRGSLPKEAGRGPGREALTKKVWGFIPAGVAVYLAIAVSLPVVAIMVSQDKIAGAALGLTNLVAIVYVFYYAFRKCQKVERDRLMLALVLLLFSVVFFTFFEQSALSVNSFTDRNVNRVAENRRVASEEIGSTLKFRVPLTTDDSKLSALPLLSQAQLGYKKGNAVFTMSELTDLREKAKSGKLKPDELVISWPVTQADVGMRIANSETPAAEYQAVNPLYILIFGLAFSALWSFLGKRGMDPSTPIKFGLALLQMALGLGMLWYGTRVAQSGMVSVIWLLLFYLLITTGELCLSPVGLSMITKLSPAKIVSTMMGVWFLGTAISEWLAGQIAKLTAVSGEGGGNFIPPPIETVHVYGKVFGQIAIASVIAAVICFGLAPLLKHWEHAGQVVEEPTAKN